MGIKLIEREHTTRTYPRLMFHRVTKRTVLVLHDIAGGIVWLNGPDAGKLLDSKHTDWDGLEDVIGSITLHNED